MGKCDLKQIQVFPRLEDTKAVPQCVGFLLKEMLQSGEEIFKYFWAKNVLLDCYGNTKSLSSVRKDFKVPHFVGFKTGWNYELFSTQLLSSPDWRILIVVTHIVGLRNVRFLQNGELHFESNSSIPQIGGYQSCSPFCWFSTQGNEKFGDGPSNSQNSTCFFPILKIFKLLKSHNLRNIEKAETSVRNGPFQYWI